jgi:hypothetical protein
MTDYSFPEDVRELIGYVSKLETQALDAEKRVAEQLEHVRTVSKSELDARETELDEHAFKLARREREIDAEIKRRRTTIEKEEKGLESRIAAFDALRTRIGDGSELIGKAWAEYEKALAAKQASALKKKSHPAPAAAKAVQEKGRALAESVRRARAAEWIVELYEWNFPWLTELREMSEAEAYVEQEGDDEPDRDDPVSDWLTAEEFRALSTAERNQRALDRYLKSRKSPWQLGRDYERYVGYLREQAGCAVTYHGIFKGLEDLGRDVLAEKGGALEVIQCKRWAKHKTIHEKHIFQLYGTMILAKLEQPKKEISGTFTTTTALSDKAREVADYLGIKVEEGLPLDDYPRIKCNIGHEDKKIYHLPFDQQYDTTVIEPDRGELYVATVAEAEERGFRRAWRWRGAGEAAATSAG